MKNFIRDCRKKQIEISEVKDTLYEIKSQQMGLTQTRHENQKVDQQSISPSKVYIEKRMEIGISVQ